jgi:hypothetical protein
MDDRRTSFAEDRRLSDARLKPVGCVAETDVNASIGSLSTVAAVSVSALGASSYGSKVSSYADSTSSPSQTRVPSTVTSRPLLSFSWPRSSPLIRRCSPAKADVWGRARETACVGSCRAIAYDGGGSSLFLGDGGDEEWSSGVLGVSFTWITVSIRSPQITQWFVRQSNTCLTRINKQSVPSHAHRDVNGHSHIKQLHQRNCRND